ncbi:MAG: hypothetical protein ACYTBJ_14405 [Planctomycetota bacterium]|jgi:hypothetical protein
MSQVNENRHGNPRTVPEKLSKMTGLVNRKQKLSLLLGMTVAIGMAVYPPWISRLIRGGSVHSRMCSGYAWLQAPPKLAWQPYAARFTLEVTHDVAQLCSQCAGVAIITASLILAFKDNQSRKVRVALIVVVSITIVLNATFFVDIPPDLWPQCLGIALALVLPLAILVLFELKK